jgi:hypothetical protein
MIRKKLYIPTMMSPSDPPKLFHTNGAVGSFSVRLPYRKHDIRPIYRGRACMGESGGLWCWIGEMNLVRRGCGSCEICWVGHESPKVLCLLWVLHVER